MRVFNVDSHIHSVLKPIPKKIGFFILKYLVN
jgi:hypothetical protein